MPCTYDTADEREAAAARRASDAEAIACAVLRWATYTMSLDEIFADTDIWDESGVTAKEAKTWWEEHSRKDLERKARDKKADREKKLKARALKKLTPEEREALAKHGLDE